jgi:hypothetical protein
MKANTVITAAQSRFSAKVFTLASIVATLIPPLLMIWIAVSIFVYASIAHHPNPVVANYNKWSGYRFYGATGFLTVFGQPIYTLVDDWKISLPLLWGILAIVVIPWGIIDIVRANKENWQDMVIEAPTNE